MTATAGSRLKPRYISGADGSRFLQGIWDTARKEACEFKLTAEGVLRCLPSERLIPAWGGFGDPSCTQPLFAAHSAEAAPKYGLGPYTFSAGNRSSITEIYSLGPYTERVHYSREGAVCKQYALGVVDTRWFIGTRIELSAFVQGDGADE